MAAAGAGDAAAVYARDAMIAWFRGEFAAANAIIDELCGHLAQIGGGEEYEAAFEAIHRRRLNWIPVLHLQKYFSIADVSAELRHVAANRAAASSFAADDPPAAEEPAAPEAVVAEPKVAVEEEATAAEEAEEEKPSGDSSDQRGIEDGEAHGEAGVYSYSREEYVNVELREYWTVTLVPRGIGTIRTPRSATGFVGGEGGCESRSRWLGAAGEDKDLERDAIEDGVGSSSRPVLCFPAPRLIPALLIYPLVKWFEQVNVVKGLKLYEDIFTDSELLALSEFVDELRLAGRGGELPGKSSLLDSCVLFGYDEHSQPYYKPPHLDNPISTLVLSETTIAFGRSLISDHEGKYKGSLTLPIKQGSLLVMRGNSADMARHVVCASPNRRVIITFVKVRHAAALRPPAAAASPTALQPTKAMTVWQPGTPPQTTTIPQKVATAGVIAWPHHRVIPAAWGLGLALHSPVVMVAPRRAMVVGPGKKAAPRNGTGVFLPWTDGPKKHTKHLPPRFQKGRLPSPLEAQA
ncbi:hypothetical protein B296_00022745 [Ensete ventricosum]|uniref:Fe2OG dioxygenase domain-containing protein n=1 Tax=Ensete ventricosum TaxID=4639 RepID=A0A426YEJ9_ENSVE|nr:hypothetical protein B296_00022745 [Ensete ventricosum]